MKNKIKIGDLVRFQFVIGSPSGTGVVLGVSEPIADGKERVALIVDPDGRIYHRALFRCQLLAKGKQ